MEVVDDAVVVAGSLRWIRPDRASVVVHEHRTLAYRVLSADAYVLDFATPPRAHHRCRVRPHALHHLGRLRRAHLAGCGGLVRHPLAARRRRRCINRCTVCAPDGVTCRVRWVESPGSITPAIRGIRRRGTAARKRRPTATVGPTSSMPRSCGTNRSRSRAGEPLALRYRLVVHDGLWSRDRLEAVATGFVA